MIPKAYILEWQKHANWKSNAQIEQDLVIERALIELFSNEVICGNLAFRGGTALHKLYLKPPMRYSEDIDLVQIKIGPIKPLMVEIGKAMSFLGNKRSIRQNVNMNTVVYRFETEIAPVVKARLKLEINTREHFAVLGWKKTSHSLSSSWYKGNAMLTTYEPEELLGTKLRALYQRSKGRDLFDLYHALQRLDPDVEKIIATYKAYMQADGGKVVTAREILLNLEKKTHDSLFLGDMLALLPPGIKYNAHEAYETVKTELIEKI